MKTLHGGFLGTSGTAANTESATLIGKARQLVIKMSLSRCVASFSPENRRAFMCGRFRAAADSLSVRFFGPPMKLQQVSENCYAILNEKNRLCDANSGYVRGAQGGALIDTQCDLSHAKAMQRLLRDVDEAIPRFVINTHEDADHVWGNQIFRDSEIVAHRSVPARMKEVADPKPIRRLVRSVDRWPLRTYLRYFHPGLHAAGKQLNEDYDFSDIELVFPETLFDDRLRLETGGPGIQLIHVGPCHQVGDAIVHVESERVLFAGDIVFNDCTPIGWAGTCQNWVSALDLIRDLSPTVIVPGHGPTCGLEVVTEMRDFLTLVWEESKRHYDQGDSAEEAACRIDLGRFVRWHCPARLYMNVARAYREFRDIPDDRPWNLVRSFDAIFRVARHRGWDMVF